MRDGTHQGSGKSVVHYHRFRGSGSATGVQDEVRIILGLLESLFVRIVAWTLCRFKKLMKFGYYHVLE